MRKFLFLAIIISALTSCRQYRYIYSASKVNSPMLTEKNDSRVNGSLSFGNAKGYAGDSSKNLGYDIQGAYALTNHLAVMASVYQRTESDVFGNPNAGVTVNYIPFSFSHVKYKRSLYEIGGGYFRPMGDGLYLSIYGGAAFGKFNIRDTGLSKSNNSYHRKFSANVSKFFIQQGFNYKNLLDLSIRFSSVKYGNPNTDYESAELRTLYLDDIHSKTRLMVEPSLTFQIPIQNWLRFETGIAVVFHSVDTNVRFWNVSMGMTLNPSLALRKKSAGDKKNVPANN